MVGEGVVTPSALTAPAGSWVGGGGVVALSALPAPGGSEGRFSTTSVANLLS